MVPENWFLPIHWSRFLTFLWFCPSDGQTDFPFAFLLPASVPPNFRNQFYWQQDRAVSIIVFTINNLIQSEQSRTRPSSCWKPQEAYLPRGNLSKHNISWGKGIPFLVRGPGGTPVTPRLRRMGMIMLSVCQFTPGWGGGGWYPISIP